MREDSLLSSLVSEPLGTVLTPGVADGFWLMAEPLNPGEHTIEFGGVIPTFGSEQDNTYTVTVVPVPEPGAVIGLIAVIGTGLGLRRRFDLADV